MQRYSHASILAIQGSSMLEYCRQASYRSWHWSTTYCYMQIKQELPLGKFTGLAFQHRLQVGIPSRYRYSSTHDLLATNHLVYISRSHNTTTMQPHTEGQAAAATNFGTRTPDTPGYNKIILLANNNICWPTTLCVPKDFIPSQKYILWPHLKGIIYW